MLASSVISAGNTDKRAPWARGRSGRIARAILLLVPLAVLLGWLVLRSPPVATRFDEALDRALSPVMEQAEAQRKLGAATTHQARLLARELSKRSVPYLGPRDLELWAATRARVARASPRACAQLWKGGDDAFLGPAIVALGDEALEAYTAMLARGLALRLERKPPPSVAPSSVERGLRTIAEALPEEVRAGFERDVKRADVSDDRACELFLMLADGAEKLEPGARVDFYRALAAELTPSG